MDHIYVNAVYDNYIWIDDSTLLVSTIPTARGAPPAKPWVPPAPKIESNEQGSISQARTFQDLLKDEHDVKLFEHYATSQLMLASLDGKVQEMGPPGIYQSFESSPDGKYVILTSFHRPYSFSVPCWRFPSKVELWTCGGRLVRELCDLPLAEDMPVAFGSVRKGMRCISWRADKPSTLYWVETQDGGDARKEVSPRDIIYSQPAEPLEADAPVVLLKLDFRYSGVSWCDESLALVYEAWHRTRRSRTWVISPESRDVSPRILFDRSSEDVYSDPGRPMMLSTRAGAQVVAKVKKENDDRAYILLNGFGATPEGNVPFLDLLDIHAGTAKRVWESSRQKYYETVVALVPHQNEGDICIDQLKIIMSRESNTENTQYYVTGLSDRKASQITHFPHPYPQLKSVQKEMIRYRRKDGVQLTATLYLPPGYNPLTDGRLPCLMWSYPEEFNSRNAAGQMRESPNEFSGIGPTSPLLWLARRFVVLYNPTIPIIGEGNEDANDRFVEQLVASAEAAVQEIVRRGVADPENIAVGGHSYGAFMAANLLAHAPHLFCCGIARSGAYNRTLTPFGFQNEERTLWEAMDTYVKMSPFMSADRIEKPLLLMHGEEDNNAGTLTMQSERLYKVLKGHGAVCRLVLLPLESHCYCARESVMHVLWETDTWLQKYCI
uniref:Probable glutamyl endopeptidase, chloroplastic n=1 Tax=Kalanchoe fedtschenkoi TaxID=63787 RepID=A0A7N0TTJ4_KALFE